MDKVPNEAPNQHDTSFFMKLIRSDTFLATAAVTKPTLYSTGSRHPSPRATFYSTGSRLPSPTATLYSVRSRTSSPTATSYIHVVIPYLYPLPSPFTLTLQYTHQLPTAPTIPFYGSIFCVLPWYYTVCFVFQLY